MQWRTHALFPPKSAVQHQVHEETVHLCVSSPQTFESEGQTATISGTLHAKLCGEHAPAPDAVPESRCPAGRVELDGKQLDVVGRRETLDHGGTVTTKPDGTDEPVPPRSYWRFYERGRVPSCDEDQKVRDAAVVFAVSKDLVLTIRSPRSSVMTGSRSIRWTKGDPGPGICFFMPQDIGGRSVFGRVPLIEACE